MASYQATVVAIIVIIAIFAIIVIKIVSCFLQNQVLLT